jgi:hypothetical protein
VLGAEAVQNQGEANFEFICTALIMRCGVHCVN